MNQVEFEDLIKDATNFQWGARIPSGEFNEQVWFFDSHFPFLPIDVPRRCDQARPPSCPQQHNAELAAAGYRSEEPIRMKCFVWFVWLVCFVWFGLVWLGLFGLFGLFVLFWFGVH
jgi:hypothetical protein